MLETLHATLAFISSEEALDWHSRFRCFVWKQYKTQIAQERKFSCAVVSSSISLVDRGFPFSFSADHAFYSRIADHPCRGSCAKLSQRSEYR